MLPSELVEAARERSIVPFIGAGVSRNLGLPDHRRLVELIAAECGYDPEIFSLLGSHQELAEYYYATVGSLGSLRSKLDREWHSPSISVRNSRVHRLIPELNAPVIYTTNYDRWIEAAYDELGRPHVAVVDVKDLRNIQPEVTQIVKFHGDFDRDDSIVLTEESYFDRLGLEGPLDLRLRSDSIARSLLFVGYSLNDINIRLLLHKLGKLWEASAPGYVRPRSFILLSRPNPVQEVILRRRGVEPIIVDGSAGEGVARFLCELIEESFGKKLTGEWD